jgi:thiamine biosynthesis lipoprotein
VKRIKKLPLLIIGALLLMTLASCRTGGNKRIEESLFALDTYITFSVSTGKGQDSRAGLDLAIKRIQEIEQSMSVTIADSDISKINNAAGKEAVKVNADTFYVIKKAIQYGELTQGKFDISVSPIVKLWDINGDNPRIPDDKEIEQVLPLVDYKKIILDEQEQTVFLKQEGMSIDLGGIAKGYAGDEVVRILKEHKVTNALINLGGNIATINGKEDGSPWRIGIQNPRLEDDSGKRGHVAAIPAKGNSIVTSGDYERYLVEVFQKTGERYHHIFDTTTGYPAKNGVISVSIVTESGIDADALSTSLFVIGVEDGLKLVNELEGIEAMFITEDKEIYLSEGLKDQISSVHSDYRIVD